MAGCRSVGRGRGVDVAGCRSVGRGSGVAGCRSVGRGRGVDVAGAGVLDVVVVLRWLVQECWTWPW